jgi:hypothetical protein
MSRIKSGLLVLTTVSVGVLITATAASADTVSGQGIASGNRNRGGVSSAGGINFAASIQINRDPARETTKVRGAARITK